jgi:opacity protein-like surface antigen
VRKTLRALSVAVATAAIPALAHAQDPMPARPFGVGGQVSYGTEAEAIGVGIRYENALNSLFPSMPTLRAVASFDLFFPGSGVTWWELNAGAVYGFSPTGSIMPYAGGGLNYTRISFDNPFGGGNVSSGDVGLNLIGGAKLRAMGTIRPYVEVRYTLGGGEQLVLTAGALLF